MLGLFSVLFCILFHHVCKYVFANHDMEVRAWISKKWTAFKLWRFYRFTEVPIDKAHKDNLLMLCFGRKVHKMEINVGEMGFDKPALYTMDVNAAVSPDFVGDVRKAESYKDIPSASMDVVIVTFCYCCTQNVLDNLDLVGKNVKRLLRDEDAYFLVTFKSKQMVTEQHLELFEKLRKMGYYHSELDTAYNHNGVSGVVLRAKSKTRALQKKSEFWKIKDQLKNYGLLANGNQSANKVVRVVPRKLIPLSAE